MKIGFRLENVPDDPADYRLASYTEGWLRVEASGTIVLEETGVLLVEFALKVEEWLRLRSGELADFYYRSMDFEDEPVLGAKYARSADTTWMIYSALSGVAIDGVTDTEIREVFTQFIRDFRNVLLERHGITLPET